MFRAVHALLYIPWFKLEPWEIPIPGYGTLPIQPFGILVAIGVLLGAKIAELFAKKNGIAPRMVSDMIAHIVIVGFVGGYFLNAAFYYPDRYVEIWNDPSRIFKVYLGLSSFGGFVGAFLGLLLWWWRRKVSPVAVSEAAAFAFPAAWFFGRMGCFTVHDHPGAITDFPLAVADYRAGVPPFEPRHDLGLYEVIWSAVVFALFLVLSRKRRRRGFYLAALPLLYAPVRFFLDYLRAGPEDGGDVRYGGLTPGQWGCIVLAIAGLAVAARITLGPEPVAPTEAPPESAMSPDGDPSLDASAEPAATEAAVAESADDPDDAEAAADGPDEDPGAPPGAA